MINYVIDSYLDKNLIRHAWYASTGIIGCRTILN